MTEGVLESNYRGFRKRERAFAKFAGGGMWGDDIYWVFSPSGKLIGMFPARYY